MRYEDLSQRQKEVVTSDSRVMLVLGGPGTGKTTTALWAARHTLQRTGIEKWQKTVFLTFSRTAVAQIAKSAPGVFLGIQGSLEVSTFHGFAWRLIKAFGRYAGYGLKEPSLESESRIKLLGRDQTRFTYADLLPAALRILNSNRIKSLIARRWPLIICDEFQDTNEEQWSLLKLVRQNSRLILLGDPNQMIYTFIKGVGLKKLEEAKALADKVIEFDPVSHRDPSGSIPTMADSIRRRQFKSEAVTRTIRSGRLDIHKSISEDRLPDVIDQQVNRLRELGCRSIGIFAHSNEGVAGLAGALTKRGIDHVLIGIPEAHADALAALVRLCEFGVNLCSKEELRQSLAVFLTACTRGKAPRLAVDIAEGKTLPDALESRLKRLERALMGAAQKTVGDMAAVAREGWRAIGITSGIGPWNRACPEFNAMVRPMSMYMPTSELISKMVKMAERRRPASLVDFDSSKLGQVQLMNFHQTKGREADGVILAYRTGDYLASHSESEPFIEASRLLFVSITRARHYVVVILPPDPHPVVAPFASL